MSALLQMVCVFAISVMMTLDVYSMGLYTTLSFMSGFPRLIIMIMNALTCILSRCCTHCVELHRRRVTHEMAKALRVDNMRGLISTGNYGGEAKPCLLLSLSRSSEFLLAHISTFHMK